MTENNIELAQCIEQALITANTLATNYNRIYKMDGYTDEYKHQKRQEMEQTMAATVEVLNTKGLAIIDKIIVATNTAERKEAERRAKDTEYNRRLHDKIETVKTLAAKPEVSPEEINALQISLSEFENDTLSIGLIQGVVSGVPGAARFGKAVPANHNGEHQAGMEKLKKLFSRAMSDTEASLKELTGIETSDNYALDMATAFQAYCIFQAPNMTSDPAAVWAAVIRKSPELEMVSKHWMMRFGIADQIQH